MSGQSIVAFGKCHTSSCTFTRPADTTTYAAGDVICNAATLIFPNLIKNGSGILQYAEIIDSQNAAAKPSLELWLFSETITAVADNAAFAPSDAEMLTHLCTVPFSSGDWKVGLSGAAGAGNAYCSSTSLGLPLAKVGANGDCYGQLVDRTGMIPISAGVYKINLHMLD